MPQPPGLERLVPELAARDAKGEVHDAIVDLVVRWPGGWRSFLLDVSVRSHFAGRYAAATRAGAAAGTGKREKARRYGLEVLPVVFEANGRLGEAGCDALAALVAESRSFGKQRRGGRQGLVARRLRLRLEAAVLREEADAVLLALEDETVG